MAAVEAGDAGLLANAIRKDSRGGREETAAFAISTQGLSALLSRCGSMPALPAALSDFLFEENLHSEARAKRLLETLLETVRALGGKGVEVVALKGAALAFFHYPDPAVRPMGDLDLLLRDPRQLDRATAALVGAGWIALFDTPRHRVFARPGERVVRPAAEDSGNPIRLEIHTSFRLPVLGHVYDASAALRAQSETRDVDGTTVAIAAGSALVTHLLFHAAEDFAGNGIRGIQAYDFRLLARARGALAPEVQSAAPLLYAADAIERLFPLTFKEIFLSSLSSRVPPELRSRAAALPALRYTRPARGWTRVLLSLLDGPVPRARFLIRTLFPTLGEVKANAAPDATGLALAAAWVRVLARRARTR